MTSWKGAIQILRFNWPAYATAGLVAGTCLYLLSYPKIPHWIPETVLLLTVYFSAASLVASHWVYDCSPLARWDWISTWLPGPVGQWILIQAGFDSTHGQLAQALEGGSVLDLYGTPGVGGSSVERARRFVGKTSESMSSFPKEAGVVDTVLAVFSLHEIHSPKQRDAFFESIHRALVPGGHLLMIEHLRDWRNFLVFGSGFLHFLPEREWYRCAMQAKFSLEKEQRITPFVKVFCWRKL